MNTPVRTQEELEQPCKEEILLKKLQPVTSPGRSIQCNTVRGRGQGRGRGSLLDRNSSMGVAMVTVAEMCVSLTMRAGSSLIMMSGISTVHMVRATTHCLALRYISPVSKHCTSSLCGEGR